MEMTLQDLPPEILIHILLYLPPLSILTCQSISHSFYNLITDSIEIQYHLRLFIAGQMDNPNSPLPMRERYRMLLAKEQAWEDLSFDFEKHIEVKHLTSGIYDLTGGIYLLGNATRRSLHYVSLPSTPTAEVEWKEIQTEHRIIDMGLCVYEHDLIAIITTHRTQANPYAFEIQLLLRQVSTGEPHPSAEKPTIIVTTLRWEQPAIGIEIVGDNLVLILSHYDNAFKPDDLVFVYDWKTGSLKMSLVAPYHSYSGVLFLSEHIFLLPNTGTNTLEIWQIPLTVSEPGPNHPILVLALPSLNPGRAYHHISCRAEPNPSTSFRHSSNPFHPNSQDAIAIFSINVRIGFFHHIQGANDLHWRSNFVFFVHRRSLLSLVSEYSTDSGIEPGPIPYNTWGPAVCRWVNSDAFPTRWITTTTGQRCVVIPDLENDDESSSFILLNFNPMDIKRAIAAEKWENEHYTEYDESNGLSEDGSTSGGAMDLGSDTGGWVTLEEWEDEEYLDGDQLEDMHTTMESEVLESMNVGPSALKRRRPKAITRHDALDDGNTCFNEIVYSQLPYTVYSSPDKYRFSGILLDEERILGLRTNPLDRITSVEVFHYG